MNDPARAGFVQDPSYAGHFGVYRRLLQRLLNHDPAMFALPKDAVIVDVGCGYGDLLNVLRKRGYEHLYGVEPDAQCRQGAREQGFDLVEGTLTATSLPDQYADAVIVNEVFHHIDDYAAAIRELRRVLKPGGLLCFLEPLGTVWRRGMDFLTFRTPLRRIASPVEARYRVMILEIETGLYPKWLAEQRAFHAALDAAFERVWLRRAWFFQFGKYRRR
jgi:ubiquinone/menaquinone biosynthesis C-methylase UbiE